VERWSVVIRTKCKLENKLTRNIFMNWWFSNKIDHGLQSHVNRFKDLWGNFDRMEMAISLCIKFSLLTATVVLILHKFSIKSKILQCSVVISLPLCCQILHGSVDVCLLLWCKFCIVVLICLLQIQLIPLNEALNYSIKRTNLKTII
jgi:hypothetical protein